MSRLYSLLAAVTLVVAVSSSPEDIPASCDGLIASTGKSAVSYLANIAASVDDKCKQTCVASICDASFLPSTSRFAEKSTTLVKANQKRSGLRSKVHTILKGGAVPQASPGCKNKCSGHGACLQDCRNKEGKECLQECKTYESDLLCSCSKRCVCNSDWGGDDCSQPLKCDGCNYKHGQCTNGKCLCDSGYEGTSCDKRIPCPKGPGGFECGGDSRGVCDYGKCTCKFGWEGDACSEKTPCPDNCSNNGMCVRGECQCFNGWTDESCSTFKSGKPCSTKKEDAKDVCSGHGVCFNGQCVCHPSYKGNECQLMKQCPRGGKDGPEGMRNKQCSNRGECFMGSCICKPGFTGENCGEELPCDCSGHGVCHGGACVCNPGFKGTNCATEEFCPGKTPTSPQGCSDHGVCNDGACFCFDGYAGDSCAFDIKVGKEEERLKNCVNPKGKFHKGHSSKALSCSGHGVCGYDKLNKPKADGGVDFGTCLCLPGFGGDYCEEEKECPKNCNGHGQCIGGVCTCRYGYSGDDCSQLDLGVHLCPNNCGDHGTCMLEECFCEPGYIGPACNITVPCPGSENSGKECSGHGSCTRGQCTCSPGFEGDSCNTVTKCPNGCSNHGVCYLGKCLCESSYAGTSCEFSPGCGDKICENNGFCRQGGCLCPNGFTGEQCERMVPSSQGKKKATCPLDDSGVECGGHGKCDGATCNCESNWSGKTCNTPTLATIVEEEEKKSREDDNEVEAVELMKEMDSSPVCKPWCTNDEHRDKICTFDKCQGCKECVNKDSAGLLEEGEKNTDSKTKQHNDDVTHCDVQKCQQAGGVCYAGVGCVCATNGAGDVCVKGITLSSSEEPPVVESLSTSLNQASASSAAVNNDSKSSWGVLSVIGMSITGCLAVVGFVAIIMIVVQRKANSSGKSNNVEHDNQTSLLIEQRVLEQERINLNLNNNNVEESVATGFVSRR